jgi:hypothetical protein
MIKFLSFFFIKLKLKNPSIPDNRLIKFNFKENSQPFRRDQYLEFLKFLLKQKK